MGNNNITTPHDRFFRSMMTDPKVIREFFEQNLPVHIRTIINFDSISAQKESFIDDHLRLQIMDLLYYAEFGKQQGYLYLLIEHQSTPCELMAFRVLKYMVAVMNHHLIKTKKNRLPIIYPLILYSGWKKYKYSTDIFDLFGDKKELAQDILWKPYQLINLSKIPDEKLKANVRSGVVLYTMKHIFKKNLIPILKNVITDIKPIENQDGMECYICRLLSYIMEVSDIDEQEFINIVKTGLTTINEDKIMTLAERLRHEGRKDGLQEGIGKGKLEALKAVAMSLYSQGMPVAQIAAVTGLSVQDIEQLKNKSAN